MLDLQVIDDPLSAIVVLDPIRTRLLAELAEPASSGALATRLGLSRQKINYHLKALEAIGVVTEVQRRRWGGLTERRLQASARTYLIGPAAMGPVAPGGRGDASALAMAASVVSDLTTLTRLSQASGKRLATVSAQADVWFESPDQREAFHRELRALVDELVSKYQSSSLAGARAHRVVVLAHPAAGSGQVGQ